MTKKLLGALEPEEFDDLVETYIDRAEPDTMSFEAFDQAVHRLVQGTVAETIELTGVVEGDSIIFDSPETAPVITYGNEIMIGGLRLVIRLRQHQSHSVSA